MCQARVQDSIHEMIHLKKARPVISNGSLLLDNSLAIITPGLSVISLFL